MLHLSFLFKFFIFQIILKENLIKSCHIRSHHGNHFSPRNDKRQFNATKITNILCPREATGKHAYPFNNFSYIVCQHSKTNIENCPHGKIFNLTNSKCILANKPKIKHLKNDYLFNCPHGDQQKHFYPYDATKYIRCRKGHLLVLDCRPSEMYSIQQRRCLPETEISKNDHVPRLATPNEKNFSNNPIVNNDTIFCPLSLFGLFPHPFSNAKYLKCVEGDLFDKSCGPGFVFNFMSKFCVENKTNLYEILPPVQHRNINESVIETQKSDNFTFIQCPKGLNGTFVHPFSCFKYISCSPAGTKINTCWSGQFYSFRKNKCEDPSKADEYDHVPCIRSNDGKNDFEEDSISLGVYCAPTGSMIYPHPQSQYKYVNCNNGKLHVMRCPRNEIFDLDDLKCIHI